MAPETFDLAQIRRIVFAPLQNVFPAAAGYRKALSGDTSVIASMS